MQIPQKCASPSKSTSDFFCIRAEGELQISVSHNQAFDLHAAERRAEFTKRCLELQKEGNRHGALMPTRYPPERRIKLPFKCVSGWLVQKLELCRLRRDLQRALDL